jgi:hypothetical protein
MGSPNADCARKAGAAKPATANATAKVPAFVTVIEPSRASLFR